MKKIIYLLAIVTISSVAFGQQLAFPTAEGGGKYTTGGRGGTVYEVTNLNDTGAGSLRDALSAGNRTVVFRVSGLIDLKSRLTLRFPNITIAGQTAPGDGICIGGYPVNIATNNVIIRFIRFRLGDKNKVEDDALNCYNGGYKNLVIDHCSMSWSVDEAASFYDVKNLSLQWCIVSESLYDSYHSKGKHGYGGIWGGQNSTFHHNLIAHHTARTPRFNGTRYATQTYGDSLDFSNNVIYNWGSTNSAYGGEGGSYNMINNYYKAGPATPGSYTASGTSNKRNRIFNYTSFYIDGKDTIYGGKFYIDGNYVHGYPDVSADNWTRGVQKDSYSGATALIAKNRMSSPFSISDYKPESPEKAYQNVIAQCGAFLPKRDAIDTRIISELVAGNATYEGNGYKSVTSTGITRPAGIIDSPSDVGGYPVYESKQAPVDTDKDGMPDTWEAANGLNPNNAADRNSIAAEGYTYLEVYLNSLVVGGLSGNKNELLGNDIKVYPNPIKDIINISIKQHANVYSIKLFDMRGQLINEMMNIDTNDLQIDCSKLLNGSYLLKIDLINGNYTTQILKVN